MRSGCAWSGQLSTPSCVPSGLTACVCAETRRLPTSIHRVLTLRHPKVKQPHRHLSLLSLSLESKQNKANLQHVDICNHCITGPTCFMHVCRRVSNVLVMQGVCRTEVRSDIPACIWRVADAADFRNAPKKAPKYHIEF